MFVFPRLLKVGPIEAVAAVHPKRIPALCDVLRARLDAADHHTRRVNPKRPAQPLLKIEDEIRHRISRARGCLLLCFRLRLIAPFSRRIVACRFLSPTFLLWLRLWLWFGLGLVVGAAAAFRTIRQLQVLLAVSGCLLIATILSSDFLLVIAALLGIVVTALLCVLVGVVVAALFLLALLGSFLVVLVLLLFRFALLLLLLLSLLLGSLRLLFGRLGQLLSRLGLFFLPALLLLCSLRSQRRSRSADQPAQQHGGEGTYLLGELRSSVSVQHHKVREDVCERSVRTVDQ